MYCRLPLFLKGDVGLSEGSLEDILAWDSPETLRIPSRGAHTRSRGALIAVRRMISCVYVCVCEDPCSSDAAVGELAPPHTSQCPLIRYHPLPACCHSAPFPWKPQSQVERDRGVIIIIIMLRWWGNAPHSHRRQEETWQARRWLGAQSLVSQKRCTMHCVGEEPPDSCLSVKCSKPHMRDAQYQNMGEKPLHSQDMFRVKHLNLITNKFVGIITVRILLIIT